MVNVRYALLDTDFVSKMHLIRKDEENKLIDKIMSMPGYIFYCHQQISEEISRHNVFGAPEWFGEKVNKKSIHVYDDKMILDELAEIYGKFAVCAYVNMLKTACSAYREEYFEEKFLLVSGIDCFNADKSEFLNRLQTDCENIGTGQNLGEIKSYVLLQTLNVRLGEQIYVFCSDDRNARNGVISIGGARCISVLSSFVRLKNEIGFSEKEADPYIKSYLNMCIGKGQAFFKVQDTSKEKKMCKVPCEQVFVEIFDGKIVEMKNGNLMYI